MAEAYTVGKINSYIKNMFAQDFVLNKVSVKGEVSNCKYHTSGHIYFTLKDSTGSLSCVMFSSSARNLKFRLKDGQKIVVKGRIDVYERDGKYQLYAMSIENEGQGDLYQRYLMLKAELEEMGMFSAQYKTAIPAFVQKVGIVTASTGAAIQDIINISKRRNPYVQLILYPAIVQGETAKYSIVKGINALDQLGVDVIIVGRGGGSIEDLWAFNEECVARAIFNCKTPIISAVGHETDYTIADFVADMRAPTPSAAAELAVTKISDIEQTLYMYNQRINAAALQKITILRNQLSQCTLQIRYLNPVNQINDKRQRTMEYENRLNILMKNCLGDRRHKFQILCEKLNGLSPMIKLGQGYSYTDDGNGQCINSIENVKINDRIDIHLKDGVIKAEVKDIEQLSLGVED